VDSGLQTIATSLLLHLKPFKILKLDILWETIYFCQKMIFHDLLYLSKTIPCLLTKAPLMYAIVVP
jgi:hypothetical protein